MQQGSNELGNNVCKSTRKYSKCMQNVTRKQEKEYITKCKKIVYEGCKKGCNKLGKNVWNKSRNQPGKKVRIKFRKEVGSRVCTKSSKEPGRKACKKNSQEVCKINPRNLEKTKQQKYAKKYQGTK